MPRRHYVMGKPTRAWSPDWQSRLIHRGRVAWTDHALHEDRLPGSPERIMRLRGHLLHKRTGTPGWPDYFSGARLDGRVLDVARQMHARGKRCHWWDLVFRPRVMFFKLYLLKGGCLEGTFGLMIAQKSAWGVQLKYAALWAVQNGLDQPETMRDEPPRRRADKRMNHRAHRENPVFRFPLWPSVISVVKSFFLGVSVLIFSC